MVSSVLLGQIRRMAAGFLTDRAEIYRESVTVGEFGEQVSQWNVLASDVPCRVITPPFDRNRQIEDVAERESAPEVYSVILPSDAIEVQAKDQIVVNGRTLRVVQAQTELTDAAFQRLQAVAHG